MFYILCNCNDMLQILIAEDIPHLLIFRVKENDAKYIFLHHLTKCFRYPNQLLAFIDKLLCYYKYSLYISIQNFITYYSYEPIYYETNL